MKLSVDGCFIRQFVAEARAQHTSAFNRWSAVAGNYLNVIAIVAILFGRRRAAPASAAPSFVALTIGHVVVGNTTWSGRALVRDPIWTYRADFAIANATIMDALMRR